MSGDDDHARADAGWVRQLTAWKCSPKVGLMIRLEQLGVRWEVHPDCAPLLEAVLKSSGRTVKKSPVKLVTSHEVGGRTWFVKRYQHEAVPLRPLKFFFKPSQARQEWDVAQQLDALGVPGVRHVALGERWGIGLRESVLITEGFAGVPLDEAPSADLSAVLKFIHGLLL